MQDPLLLNSLEDSLLTITLNRPQKRNALSVDLMLALREELDRAAGSREVRAVILAASGKAFCAGHDLAEMTGKGRADYERIFDLCTQLMERIQSIPQPVIACVQGVATAAGCQLVATCDLAVASTDATFATPGVKIGLFCSTPMVAVSRAVGRKRAMEMLLTGRQIDAATAAEWGLINRAVPPERLVSETRGIALEIVRSSGFTLAVGKHAFYKQIGMEQPPAYAYTKQVMTRNALAHDAQEGMSAFLEKRDPCWEGR
jgi:enoyl-CoA hydratase/carnithine racemase